MQNHQQNRRQTSWIASRTFSHLLVFSALFGLIFFWLHFAGPRRVVGYWIEREPLSIVPSAVLAFVVALVVTVLLVRRVG